MNGWTIRWWQAMLVAALLSQGCGKAVDETGRRAGEGPALPLKKPIYSSEGSTETPSNKKKPNRPRRRNPGAALPVRPVTPAKQVPSPREDVKNPEVIQPDFSWDEGLAMGFAPHPWPTEITSLLIEDPKGLKFQKVVSVDRAIRFSFEADDNDDERHVAGVRIKARHAKGLMLDFQVESQEGRAVQFVSVVATDQNGRRLGRYRSRLAKSKSGASPPRTVQQVKFNPLDPDFELVDDDAELGEVHWVEILFQVAPKSTASVILHQLAVLPAPPQPIETVGRDSFLKSEDRTEEPSLAQRIGDIQRYVDQQGGDWKTWFDSLESARIEIESQLRDQQGYLETREGHALVHLERISHAPSEAWPGPQIKALTALDQFLTQRGIELWIVPIPSSEQVFADRFVSDPPQDGRVDVYRDYMLQSLMRQNLKVIDVWPTLREQNVDPAGADNKQEKELFAPLFYSGKTDVLTPRGQRRVARRIAESLAQLRIESDYDELGVTRTELEIAASLTRKHPKDSFAYEWVPQVLDSSGSPLNTLQSGGQILLVGDETTLRNQAFDTPGVGMASYITLETGLRLHTRCVPGAAPQLIRSFGDTSDELLQGKRLCILMFAEELLYQNGDGDRPIWETAENLGVP